MNELTSLVDAFERLWAGGSQPDLDAFLSGAGAIDPSELSRLARIDQRERWQRGERRTAEEYLHRYPALQADHESAVDLIYHEYLMRERRAEQPSIEEFTSRFPQHALALSEQIGLHRALANAAEIDSADAPPITETVSDSQLPNPLLPKLPAQFGRYRAVELLGRGAMGNVYLADDPELGRQVALKLPRLDRAESPEAWDRFRREARIAATFHHPNLCPVYDFGEIEGTLFLTMPCMTGRPLSAKLQAGPLSVNEAARIALTIARAMSVAHQAGVVHRDLKPSNILMREDGEPVVMDFGLARRDLDLDPKLTGSGALVGTLAYMAPEQLDATGDEVSPASDIYSLGVILYEMLTGRPPFEGSWQAVWEQIRSQAPVPPSEHVPGLSSGLNEICLRALAKHPQDRFESMDALADAFAQNVEQDGAAVNGRGMVRTPGNRRHPVAANSSELRTIAKPIVIRSQAALETVPTRRRRLITVSAVAAALAIAFGWFAWQSANKNWARRQIPEIVALAKSGRTFEAYELAGRARKSVPDDPKLTRLIPAISTILKVDSEPSGARVYLKRFIAAPAGTPPAWTFVGTTPLLDFEVARADYLVSIEKEGYEAFQRTWSDLIVGGVEAPITFEPIAIEAKLIPSSEAPAGMVFVPGGDHRLGPWRRPTDKKARLDNYFIDKCEVTNRQYKEFVDANGYEKERYWPHSFVKDGRTLSREEAMRDLRDSTGHAGPRGWSKGNYPEGKAEHPVTRITWYEAAAYAAYRGKSLPTIFQWEKAAKHGVTKNFLDVTMPWGLFGGSIEGRANLQTRGAVPVGSFEFGMSPFGSYDMAGNVAEWCLNETSAGFIACGGSWASNPQAWGLYAKYPEFHHSDEVGFRCVVNRAGAASDQGAMSIELDEKVPEFEPAPEADVKSWIAKYYSYDQHAPLDERVTVHETDEWRRERIEYNGADGQRAIAYLYLPKHFPGPYQVIHLKPAGDVRDRFRTVPQSIEADYASYIRSGRAIFAVALPGYLEREHLPVRFFGLDWKQIEYVEANARDTVDLRRGLDYLLSRPDMDPRGVAFLGHSFGGPHFVLPAIETRYRAVILSGAGIGKTEEHEAANAVNFVPLIQPPKLLVHGRFDEGAPLKTVAEPLYNLLAEPKEQHIYEGGHRPDPEEQARVVNAWLDKTLGPVTPGPSQK